MARATRRSRASQLQQRPTGSSLRGMLIPWARHFHSTTSLYSVLANSAPSSTSILTLRPEKLASANQELIDLSGFTRKYFSVESTHPEWPNVNKDHFLIKHWGVDKNYPKFPLNTRGFLYYHHWSTPIGGQLRFRLCDSASSFYGGRDLVTRTGMPWSVPLVDIVKWKAFRPIIPLLLQDHLVDDSLLEDAMRKYPEASMRLYTLSDPWIFDLSAAHMRFALVTRKSVHYDAITHIASDHRSRKTVQPYQGRIWARFELSKLPEHAQDGPTVVIKFLDTVEPMKALLPMYDGHIGMPISGNYFIRAGKVWRLPMAKRMDRYKDLLEASSLQFK